MKESYSKIIFLSIYPSLHIILVGIMYWIGFNAINQKFDLLSGVLFAIITNLLLIVNITPQNIGIREIFIGFMAVVAGQTFSTGLLVSTIIRICGLIMHIIIGVPSLIMLKRENSL